MSAYPRLYRPDANETKVAMTLNESYGLPVVESATDKV